MDPIRDLPMGFGMALLQNQRAYRAFASLSPARQQEILQATHAVSSKAEMQALVDRLAQPQGNSMGGEANEIS